LGHRAAEGTLISQSSDFKNRRNFKIEGVMDLNPPPPQFNSCKRTQNPMSAWRSMFPKRLQADLDRSELQSLRLREIESGNRLTVDVEAQRIEIASAASEVEREWLARLLARRYSLRQVSGNAANAI
jgi:hypothetical protein